MKKRMAIVMGLIVLALMLCASLSWATVGVYQVEIGDAMPAQISYMLSKNADSIKIEVVRASDSNVVYTFPTYTDTGKCGVGYHQNAVTWTGLANDGGIAPSGIYRARITAVGPKVGPDTGNTKLIPLWEFKSSVRPYGIAVNNNPTSKLRGRIYVAIATGAGQGVCEYYADGSPVIQPGSTSNRLPAPTSLWGGYAPWAVAIDGDDHIFVTERVNGYIWCYARNTAQGSWELTPSASVPVVSGLPSTNRSLVCRGSGTTMRMIWTGGADPIPSSSSATIISFTGDPPANPVYMSNSSNDAFMQPAIDQSGSVYVAGVASKKGTPQSPGSVTQWTFGQTTLASRNTYLSNGTGLALTTDDQYMWMGRYATTTASYRDVRDTSVTDSFVYKFPVANTMSVDPYGSPAGVLKYGINTSYTGTYKTPQFLAADSCGNLAIAGGESVPGGIGYYFGVYEEPTSGPTTTVAYSPMADPPCCEQFEIVSFTMSRESVPIDGVTSARVTVVVKDLCAAGGGTKIGSVKFYAPAMGIGDALDDTTGAPMSRVSSSGNQFTYMLDVTASTNSDAGEISTCVIATPVTDYLQPPAKLCKAFTLTGGYISGRVLNGRTGAPAANITMKATRALYSQEALTDTGGYYTINVTPGQGYSVEPKMNGDSVTFPTEYNVGDGWPSTSGENDWPKSGINVTLYNTTPVDGINSPRVWPLAVTQVTYDWGHGAYKPGGRTVCVEGTVLRQSADPAVPQKGYNDYYWIEDSLSEHGVQSVKVTRRAGDPAIRKGDKVVVVGAYNVPASYNSGSVDVTTAPWVTAGGLVPQPTPIEYGNALHKLTGSYYMTNALRVTQVDAANSRFCVQMPHSGSDSTLDDVWVCVDTLSSTGATLPPVGAEVAVTGVLGEIGAEGETAILPGCADDLVYRTLAGIKGATAGGVAVFAAGGGPKLVVTYVDPVDISDGGGQWFWVESADRTAGLKVSTGGGAYLPAGIAPGAEIRNMAGTLAVPTDAGRVLQLTGMPSLTPDALFDIPAFLGLNTRAYGGGDWLGTPAVIGGSGVNTDGLLVRVAGMAYWCSTDTNYEWFYLDDGSFVPNENDHTGVKVIRSKAVRDPAVTFTFTNGTPVIAEGICTSVIGPGGRRVRVLHVRYDPANGISDRVRAL